MNNNRFPVLIVVSAIILCAGVNVSCSGSSDTEVLSEEKPEIVREVTLSVPSVTCDVCLLNIRKEVITEPGVVSMDGDSKEKTVLVRLSKEAPENNANLIAAVKRAGYEATVK